MAKKDTAPAPMDDSVREVANPTTSTNHPRVCWAIKTLVSELTVLFPEIGTPEYGDVDGRNTALSVTFDCSMVDEDDQIDLSALLSVLPVDPRVADTEVGSDQAYVLMHANPRTQDTRDPFGLADAIHAMEEGMEAAEAEGDVPWDWENAASFAAPALGGSH